MAKYDGLIIPRSYNEYINKSDPLAVTQALQLTGVMDNAPTAQSTKPAKSGGIFAANAVIMANNKTLSGVAISAGSVVRVLFTAALTGSDATTGLTLTYNGTAYAVKVGKNGALANFNAYEVESGVFKYLQAYTTLELMFDGTQFIIIGNPVVLSSADYTIYPDGNGRTNVVAANNLQSVTSGAVADAIDTSRDWIILATTTQNDEHITIPNLTQFKELMFSLHRSDGRVCGSSVIPVNVFNGGGVYAIGIDSLQATITEYGVAVWKSNTQIEIAGTYYQARFFGR